MGWGIYDNLRTMEITDIIFLRCWRLRPEKGADGGKNGGDIFNLAAGHRPIGGCMGAMRFSKVDGRDLRCNLPDVG